MEELASLNIDQLRSLLYLMISNSQQSRDIFDMYKSRIFQNTTAPQQNNTVIPPPQSPNRPIVVPPSQMSNRPIVIPPQNNTIVPPQMSNRPNVVPPQNNTIAPPPPSAQIPNFRNVFIPSSPVGTQYVNSTMLNSTNQTPQIPLNQPFRPPLPSTPYNYTFAPVAK
jgi:hypothetical protein